MQKKTIKVKTLITEDEKNSNPIFKAIYKKIRNLTKKIGSIETLQKQGRDNLKPQQILKIQKREQIAQQIVKCEEFAIFYKELLQDKETANTIITDELIKIATALSVCQAIKHDGGYKDKTLQQVKTKIIQPIIADHNPNMPVGERIVETVGLLTEFLQNDKYYTSCRNYISEIARSSAIQSSKQSEKASSHFNKNKPKKQFQEVEQDKVKQNSNGKQQNDQNKKAQKQTHTSQEKEKKQVTLEAKKSHSQEKQHKTSTVQLQNQPPKVQVKHEGKQNQEKNQGQAKKEQPKQVQDAQQDKNNSKKFNNERKNQGRNYRQNKDYNNQNRNYNRNQQYQGGKPRNLNRDKQYQERPRNYKPRETVREGSDTSLEPTPQKNKKPKYVEKV